MKNQTSYEEQLKTICEKLKESISIKSTTISKMKIHHYLKELIKLNKKTKNQNINEIITAIGRTNIAYKNHCKENNYYTNTSINKIIKQAYCKLSKKQMKINTNKSKILKDGEYLQIEYNYKKGLYALTYLKNDKFANFKEYKIKNIRNLDVKREKVIEELKRINYGIDIFDELQIDENTLYKVNPDIIHILISEGKIDYAKMYIKEVVGGEFINKPFEIKYILDKNFNNGVFSYDENKAMMKMAKRDSLASKIVMYKEKSEKTSIKSPKCNKICRFTKNKNGINEIEISNKIKNIIRKKEVKKEVKEKIEIMQNERRKQIIEGIKTKKNAPSIERVNKNGCVIFNVNRTDLRNNPKNNVTKNGKPNIHISYNIENASRRVPERTR